MTMIRAMAKCLAYHPSEGSRQVPTSAQRASGSRSLRCIQGRAHAREQVGTRPGLGKERQRGIERIFTTSRAGIAARKEERRGPPFPPVDLIQPAPAEPAHHQIAEDEINRLGGLTQQVQRFDAIPRGENRISRPFQRVDGCAPELRLIRSEEHTSELQSLAYLVCR